MHIRTISLWQPWASLLVAGIKRVETRSYPINPKFFGRLYIHATKTIPAQKYLKPFLRDPDFNRLAGITGENFAEHYQCIKSLPLGMLIGSVNVVACYPAFKWLEICRKNQKGFTEADWDREFILGDLGSCRYAWICEDFQAFKSPIAVHGHQGFFDSHEDVCWHLGEDWQRKILDL